MSDLIKRSDAIKTLCDITNNSDMPEDWHRGMSVSISALYRVPSADRPQGEWIDEADKYDASFGIHDYRCSNCNSYADEYIGGHEWYTADKPNFCPHCGADMREREGE